MLFEADSTVDTGTLSSITKIGIKDLANLLGCPWTTLDYWQRRYIRSSSFKDKCVTEEKVGRHNRIFFTQEGVNLFRVMWHLRHRLGKKLEDIHSIVYNSYNKGMTFTELVEAYNIAKAEKEEKKLNQKAIEEQNMLKEEAKREVINEIAEENKKEEEKTKTELFNSFGSIVIGLKNTIDDLSNSQKEHSEVLISLVSAIQDNTNAVNSLAREIKESNEFTRRKMDAAGRLLSI